MFKNLHDSIRKTNFIIIVTILTIAFLLISGFVKFSKNNNFNFISNSQFLNLSQNLTFFAPKNGEDISIDEITNKYYNCFTKNSYENIYFPGSVDNVWLKVNLNGTQRDTINVIYLDSNFIENVNFYIPTTDNKFIVAKPNGYFLFPYIYLPRNTDYNKDVYVSLNWTSHQFKLVTAKNSDFYILQSFLTIFYVCNLGIVLGMIIMNIILFFTSRDNKYLFHSLFTTSLLTTLYCLSGIPNLILGYISFNDLISPGALVALTWILFIYSYLDIKNNLPSLNNIFKIFTILPTVLLFISHVIPSTFTYPILYIYLLLSGLSIIISAYCYFKLKIGSMYYLIGILILFIGIIMYTFAVNGILKWNMLTTNAWCPALSIETLLFTIGIIDQVKTEKERNNKLQLEVITDKLTNLYNRRYLEETVLKQITDLDLTKNSVSMMLFDIDHFKNFNDTYGHDVGDSVLTEASIIISQCLGKDDILCRWGGEEFVAILFFTNIQDGILTAENIRRTIENHKFNFVDNLTISIGISEKTPDESFEAWLKRTDEAMYKAKASGRNRVCISYPNKIPFLVEWNKIFESGNKEIDIQHKDLIRQLNLLIENYYGNFNKERFLSIFNDVIEAMVKHFVTEENILTSINYSELEEHKRIHERIIYEAFEIKDMLYGTEINPKVINKFLVNNVIIGHLLSDDTNYYKYLNND